MKNSIVRKKYNGYILLFTMLLVSSIFLLVMSIITKNRLANSVAQTIGVKHEQNILILNALAIIQSLINNPINKPISNDQGNKSINLTSNEIKKEYTGNKDNDKNKLIESYFELYWQQCNRWLHYQLNYDQHKFDGVISIYLTVEDGKLALKKFYQEYYSELKKEKEKQDEKSEENQKNKDENKNSNAKKSNNEKEGPKGGEHEGRDTINEVELQKSTFLKEIKEKFEKLEEKNLILKELFEKKDNKNNKSAIINLVKIHFDNNRNGSMPINLLDVFCGVIEHNRIFGEFGEAKEISEKPLSSFYNLASIENEEVALLYASPSLLEFLSQKKIDFTQEMRNKILEKGLIYCKQNTQNSLEKLWSALFSEIISVPYPKEILDNQVINKIFSSQLGIPYFFSAIIKVEVMKSTLFAIATFEKTKIFDKDNKEYLIKSIYILPT